MKKNAILTGSVLLMLTAFWSCDEPTTCPEGNLCIIGNTVEYQLSTQSARLTLINPEGAVVNNTAIEITDMVPGYPAQVDYNTVNSHFGGGMFKIEPFDVQFSTFLTIRIKYPDGAETDYLGNDYAPDFRMYYVKDGNWSVVNESYCDVEAGEVVGNVLRLGQYTIAAKKETIEGDFIVPSVEYTNGYSSRIVFLHDKTGFREWIVDCDTALLVNDFQLARDSFKYALEDDLLNMTNFSASYYCNHTGPVLSTDTIGLSYYVDDVMLTIDGFGTWSRRDN